MMRDINGTKSRSVLNSCPQTISYILSKNTLFTEGAVFYFYSKRQEKDTPSGVPWLVNHMFANSDQSSVPLPVKNTLTELYPL